ncbi:MAG TPA: hypothetical protein VH643_08955 [Gemmataceae bacterium]|jgi:hypothetical protein
MSRREREKRAARRERSRQGVREQAQRQRPNLHDYFPVLTETVPIGAPVVLYCRESSDPQEENLPAQIYRCWQAAQDYNVVGILSYVAKAWDTNHHRQVMRDLSHFDTPFVVAEYYDRYLRHKDWGRNHNIYVEPTVEQLDAHQALWQRNAKMPLVVHKPASSEEELFTMRSQRIKGGIELHGDTQREYFQKRIEWLSPIVQGMRERGFSYRALERVLPLKKSTLERYARL